MQILHKLGLKKKEEKPRGRKLVAEVIGRFTDIAAELESGIEDCMTERDGVRNQIQALNQEEESLTDSIGRAATVKGNLLKILGE